MASLRFMGLAVIFAGAIGLYNALFTVDQTQQAHPEHLVGASEEAPRYGLGGGACSLAIQSPLDGT